MSRGDQVEFERMAGFHRLESLWRIEYKAVALEPVITQAATEEAKTEVSDLIGKTYAKEEIDLVPLAMGDKAIITGNAVKGLFRHVISAQMAAAGLPVCVQKVKLSEGESIPEGRIEECTAENPCFVCTWFGTAGRGQRARQGALHFSILESKEPLSEVIVSEPIPMIALSDEREAAVAVRGRGRFALVAPIKAGTEFTGWIKGENLSEEIIGAIAEVVEMSRRGFIQFGGLKTRGMGAMRLEITRIEKYRTVPKFELEAVYVRKEEERKEGEKGEESEERGEVREEDLDEFLKTCRKKYHELLARGRAEGP